MSERIHALAQHLLGKSSIEECSLEELQHLTKRYPFFAPAQFLLLQKLKTIGSPDAVAQHRKAMLYFHDPLQFNYFLSREAYHMDDLLLDEEEPALTQEPETVVAIPDLSEEEATEEPLLPSDDNFNVAPEKNEDILNADEAVFPEPDMVVEETVEPVSEPAVLPAEPLPEEPGLRQTEVHEDETASVQAVSLVPAEEKFPEPAETETGPSKAEDLPLANTPVEARTTPASGDILFEPYYTVDYFASQGIKVTAEDVSKDKLSKQLRSFTEWLKIMKRLPAAEIARTPQSRAEKSVENMASHSVEESEVVTETMAEVWAKQGAREKAIETYNKLSLQNPSKKAYFAAKIENLKGS